MRPRTSHPALPTLLQVNWSWEQLGGWTSTEAVGQACRLLQGAETRESLDELRAALATKSVCTARLVNYKTSDRSSFYADRHEVTDQPDDEILHELVLVLEHCAFDVMVLQGSSTSCLWSSRASRDLLAVRRLLLHGSFSSRCADAVCKPVCLWLCEFDRTDWAISRGDW